MLISFALQFAIGLAQNHITWSSEPRADRMRLKIRSNDLT